MLIFKNLSINIKKAIRLEENIKNDLEIIKII